MKIDSINATSFSSLPLKEELLTNLASLGFDTMTPIQVKSLPILLSGDDIIAKARTGSGKTAAYGLAVLNNVNLRLFAAQALILCPTRELAEQVAQSIRQLARQIPNVKIINLSGGMPMKAQLDSLRHGAHVIVGTPGRVQKHIDKETLALDKLQWLVLDEADRMLDMGFLDAIRSIVKSCPKKRQTLLFSATYPKEITLMSYEFMNNPKEIFVDEEHIEPDIEQQFHLINESNHFSVLTSLLKQHKPESTLVFCNTKKMTADIADRLREVGFSARALHGDMEQVDRDLAIIQFTNQSCSILVATDVAARGLDIKALPLVINYELAHDLDTHTHRVGRTGRAGHKGLAVTLTKHADAHRINAIEDHQKAPLTWIDEADTRATNALPDAPLMTTLCLDLGKKDKIRAGDIVGALTKDASLPNEVIGKIDVLPLKSYVAIHKTHVAQAYQCLKQGTLKGRRVNVQML